MDKEGCIPTSNGTKEKPETQMSSSVYPMKFWGLLGMVAPTAHTTQQSSFAKSDSFHWSRQIL